MEELVELAAMKEMVLAALEQCKNLDILDIIYKLMIIDNV